MHLHTIISTARSEIPQRHGYSDTFSGWHVVNDGRGGRFNYFDGLGSSDYFCESNRYFLPVTLDPITFQFH